MTFVDIVSIVSGLVSTILAVFAIWQANESRKESQQNSIHIGQVLKEIEANSTRTREYVAENERSMREDVGQTQKSLMDMQKELVSVFTKRLEADIPQRLNASDQLNMTLMQAFAAKPEEFLDLIQKFQASQNLAQSSKENDQSS
jgi:hypothetical protein